MGMGGKLCMNPRAASPEHSRRAERVGRKATR